MVVWRLGPWELSTAASLDLLDSLWLERLYTPLEVYATSNLKCDSAAYHPGLSITSSSYDHFV